MASIPAFRFSYCPTHSVSKNLEKSKKMDEGGFVFEKVRQLTGAQSQRKSFA
jgi:hypothetical protein